MEGILYYMIKVCLASSVMVITYLVFFRKKNMLLFNRFYLLTAAILPWIIPLITLTFTRRLEILPTNTLVLVPVSGVPAKITVDDSSISTNLLILIPFIVYLIGLLFFLLRLLMSFVKVNLILKRCSREQCGNNTVYVTEEEHLPFSFFNKMIISRDLLDHPQLDLILRHERIHVSQGHSFDILIAETVKALQWFNPFAWILAIQVKTNLEYMADALIAQANGDVTKYQCLLISLANGNMPVQLVSGFNQTRLKKRVIMMKKQVHPKKLNGRCLLALLVIAVLLLSFCKKEIRYVTQDELMVTGQVTTVTGHIPIPGVYVGVKGEVVGTATDVNGNYNIQLNDPADTLEVIYTDTELIVPNGRTRIDLSLEDANRLLQNIDRVLGPDADPVVIVNDQRVDKGLKGINPRMIQSLQVLEGDKAVQTLGSEEARNGLVIIKHSTSSSSLNDYHIYLDGKKYSGSFESINPHYIRFMGTGGLKGAYTGTTGKNNENDLLPILLIITDLKRTEKVKNELLGILSGEILLESSKQPVIFINGKRYEKDLRNLNPDEIISVQYFETEAAYELSGVDEARENGLFLITKKNPLEQ